MCLYLCWCVIMYLNVDCCVFGESKLCTELFPRQLLHVAFPNNLLVREEDVGILVVRVGAQQHCLWFKTNFPVSYFLLISPEH